MYKGAIDKYKKFAPGKKALCFNSNVEHSRAMTAEFNFAGISSRHIDGKTPDHTRAKILSDFAKGEFLVLNNCGVLTTGYDEPSIECIIINRATLSLSLFLQMVGRGSRPYSGKDKFIILDMGSNIFRHGWYEQARAWSLDPPKRKSALDGIAPVKSCPKCEALFNASIMICKYCKYVFPVKEKILAEGTFVELKPKIPIKKLGPEFHKMTEDELFAYAKDRGYKPGWVKKQLALREARTPEASKLPQLL
jgi:superfamily II DNA or RNA helicase